MQPAQVPPERDLEFRTAPSQRHESDWGPVEDYQRLVANPFLGVIGIMAWLAGIYLLIQHSHPMALLPLMILWSVGGIRIVPLLFHFHCRDCGSSGPLHRWRTHSCPAILQRRHLGLRRRLRGPSPPAQALLWFYLLVAFAVFMSATGWPIHSLIP